MNARGLPFFSIVIPTYNRPSQLSLCLQAVTGLDYPNDRFEVVVVDDGSAHPPNEIVSSFTTAFPLRLFRQERTGPAAARNFGSLHARGEFLAFTDDDCQPEAGWLRELAPHCAAKPDRIIGGRTINALPKNPYAETSQTIIEVVYSYFNADPDNARFFASNNFAVPAEQFRRMNGFAEQFVTSEDREICARWRADGRRLTYAPEAIVYHAHDLDLASLWRQHFAYGRGARRFHGARSRQGDPPFKPELAFYLKLLRASLAYRQKSHALRQTALMVWAQLANAAGFLLEKG